MFTWGLSLQIILIIIIIIIFYYDLCPRAIGRQSIDIHGSKLARRGSEESARTGWHRSGEGRELANWLFPSLYSSPVDSGVPIVLKQSLLWLPTLGLEQVSDPPRGWCRFLLPILFFIFFAVHSFFSCGQ